MSLPEIFRCYYVKKDDQKQVTAGIAERSLGELPAGEVLIQVAYSSLNYKDALAATGHPGVVRNFPHIPGIDAAGTVVESSSPEFNVGDQVLVTSYDLGAARWGGWSQFVRVPQEWVIRLPENLTAREAMIYGTAGLTAALSIAALERNEVTPAAGPILVTGATGGVGSLAVRLLAKLGYQVVAVTGKLDAHELLRGWGAAEVVARDAVLDDSTRPLLTAQWGGAVDSVGGKTLASIVRSTKVGGCVTACGLVGGIDLNLSVHPFILRGVTLAGIDSAWCDRARRLQMWNQLAGPWRLADLDEQVTTVGLTDLDDEVQRILQGQVIGRVIVDLAR